MMSATSGNKPGDPPLPLEVEDFLSHLVVEKGRSSNTLAAYRRDLRKYSDFLGPTTVLEARYDDVESFAQALANACLLYTSDAADE